MLLRAGLSALPASLRHSTAALVAAPCAAPYRRLGQQQQPASGSSPSPRTSVQARFYADDGSAGAVIEPAIDESAVKLYAAFGVYKGKAAMQTSIIGPTWEPYISKNAAAAAGGAPPQPRGETVNREGVMFLQFATVNAGAGSRPGDRTYNWQDKGTFALKAVELGRIFSHNFADPAATKGVELYHDSSKVAGARPGEGATGKTLRITQNPDGTYAFNLTVRDAAGGSKNYYVVVDRAEFYVLKSIADRAIPHLLGLMP